VLAIGYWLLAFGFWPEVGLAYARASEINAGKSELSVAALPLKYIGHLGDLHIFEDARERLPQQ
jgi:hypothetical protein